jgi:mannose-6-phosphate isomerase-like protein (cupin superfamily)
MKLAEVEMKGGFRVLFGTERSQAATMVLGPGQSTGGRDNRHPESDQWLLISSGEGTAVIEGKEVHLQAGSLLLIEAGESHEIRNEGEHPLETLSLYSPPAY